MNLIGALPLWVVLVLALAWPFTVAGAARLVVRLLTKAAARRSGTTSVRGWISIGDRPAVPRRGQSLVVGGRGTGPVLALTLLPPFLLLVVWWRAQHA